MPSIGDACFRTRFAVSPVKLTFNNHRELAVQLFGRHETALRMLSVREDEIVAAFNRHPPTPSAANAFIAIFDIAMLSSLPLEIRSGRKLDLDLMVSKAGELAAAHPYAFTPHNFSPFRLCHFVDWIVNNLDLHDTITLGEGKRYPISGILDGNRYDLIYKVEGVSNQGGFLIALDKKEPRTTVEGLTFPGEKTVIELRQHDPQTGISVYEVLGDEYDLEMQRASTEGVGPLCRNIRSYGMVRLFEDRESANLDSPDGNFGTTTLTKNYSWAETFEPPFDLLGFPQKGFRPGPEEQKYNPVNRFVFVVFPGEGLIFKPMLRSCGIFDDFDFGEYWTGEHVRYRDSLLVTGKDEYQYILSKKAVSRTEALHLLGRSEQDQQVFENLAYEEAHFVTQGTGVPIDRTAGYAVNDLFLRLLTIRGGQPIDRGLLFHLFQPTAGKIQLFGTFNGWSGTSMQRDESGLWWSVVPNLEPGSTVLFKFRIEHPDGRVEWARGVNPINSDPYGNARLWVTGAETLYSREISLARSQILHQ